MILSDTAIRAAMAIRQIVIDPFDPARLGSNSYDLTLGSTLLVYEDPVLDARADNPTRAVHIPPGGLVLSAGVLYLGVTVERTESHDLVPTLEGKSSVARLGIQVHLTAGFGDSGFCGHWTLEILCAVPVRVYAGMPIAQLAWSRVDGKVAVPYHAKASAKYANQAAVPVASMMHRNFKP